MGLSEYLFIALFFGLPGLAGAWLARSRGRNPLLWGLLSPDREIQGYFRQCRQCGGIYPWKLTHCRYCGQQHAET
jgi:hypothetical protein